MADNLDNFIPILWQGDGQNPSPNNNSRKSLYGVGGIPHAQFGGSLQVVGGGGNMYPNYLSKYNQIVDDVSPLEIDVSLNINGQNQLVITADVEVTENITTTNNNIAFIITRNLNNEYFCSAAGYEFETFNLTSIGETGIFERAIPIGENWDLSAVKALVLVQTFSGNHQILQAAETGFSGTMPLISSNVQIGPPSLAVQYTDLSLPAGEITSWEWDLDGDGTFDSTEQNPSFDYEEIGTYNITLRIFANNEYVEATFEDFITVTDGSNISGNLSGTWAAVNNPFIITDDVSINEEDQLMLSAGVELIFADDTQLTVNGAFLALGSESNPISLSSDTGWKGLRFNNTQELNLVHNCIITNANQAAIKVENDSFVEIIGNDFYDNTVAIEVVSSNNVKINENFITNNISTTEILLISNSAPQVENNIIVNNEGNFGSFSIKSGSQVTLLNNTIANNSSSTSEIMLFNSTVELLNTILITDNASVMTIIGDQPSVNYSCISGGFTGTGNIDEDPLFVEPTIGIGAGFNGFEASWWLQASSPCVDAGNPDVAYNDADGSRNDMGAFGGPNGLPQTNADEDIVITTKINTITTYPNPFNPQTTILLNITDLDKLHPVTLKIYNVKGQLVKTVVDNELVQNNSYVWNGINNSGNSVSSGMYLINLTTRSNVISQKVMLLK